MIRYIGMFFLGIEVADKTRKLRENNKKRMGEFGKKLAFKLFK